MRFLIGLICGAAVILLLAQAAGTAERGWLERVPALLDGVARKVGDALDLPPRPSSDATASERSPALPAPAPQQQDATSRRGADPRPGSADRPSAGPDLLTASGTPGSSGVSGPAGVAAPSGVPTVSGGPEPATQPIPRPPDPRPVDADEEPTRELAAELFLATRDDVPASEQAVWAPFHSEMSANGFADRLSQSLDHPFRVERRGPGRYQVVFGYRDEQQRRELLDEAAAATGLPL